MSIFQAAPVHLAAGDVRFDVLLTCLPALSSSFDCKQDEAEVGRTANEAQDLSAHSLLTMLEGLSSTESVLPLSRHVDSLDPFTVYSADSLLPSGSLQDVAILPSGLISSGFTSNEHAKACSQTF